MIDRFKLILRLIYVPSQPKGEIGLRFLKVNFSKITVDWLQNKSKSALKENCVELNPLSRPVCADSSISPLCADGSEPGRVKNI